MPPDPFLTQNFLPMAKSAHDMFLALLASGFTEPQAMQVIVAVVCAIMTAAQE